MRYLKTISILLFIIACESKTEFAKPKDLIPRDQMIEMLLELHMGVAAQGIKNKHLERNENYLILVYEKYNIDSVRFSKSNNFYMSDIEEYEKMFDEVKQQMKLLREKYDLDKDTIYEIEKRIEEYEENQKIEQGAIVK